MLQVTGPNVGVFSQESGGHRWQRVPPTEKRGRVQTSTVTVAIFDEPTPQEFSMRPSDVEWSAVRGSGAGGQHRNTTNSAVRVKHLPTGIEARCESERSQHQNRAVALAVLAARVYAHGQAQLFSRQASDRRLQVGSGMRGDKRRTIRVQDGQVVDHVTGRTWRTSEYLSGRW